jgi:hypothetical protein
MSFSAWDGCHMRIKKMFIVGLGCGRVFFYPYRTEFGWFEIEIFRIVFQTGFTLTILPSKAKMGGIRLA